MGSIPRSRKIYVVAAVIIVAMGIAWGLTFSIIYSQGTDFSWWTGSGNEYRTATVPLTYSGGFKGSIIIKWSYTMYESSFGPWGFSISTNPLVVDLDLNGRAEVVITNDAGELIILDGLNGNQLYRGYVDASPFATPTIYDVNNDQVYEIYVPTRNGTLRAYSIDTTTWTLTLEWETIPLGIYITCSPLIIDIDNDNILDLVVEAPSGIYRLNPETGNIISSIRINISPISEAVISTGDVDNDNVIEVLASDSTGYLYLVDLANTNIEWALNLTSYNGFILHTPVVSDTDNDNNLEIIVVLGKEVFDWVSANSAAKTGVDGQVIIVDPTTGTIEAVIDPTGAELFSWFSIPSIAVADLDFDGVNEIVVGSGDGYIYLIQYNSGTYAITDSLLVDTGWSQFSNQDAPPVAVSVVILDINGDNIYEIVAYSTDDRTVGGGLDYTLYVINSAFNVLGERTITYADAGVGSDYYSIFSWPSIAVGDIDGDNTLELVAVSYQGVIGIDWG